MKEAELLRMIKGGENIQVEFKKSTTEITKDVYDTVCSFSNRDGGLIILGVKDNGEILGVDPKSVDRIKKDFVTSVNNGQKINPPLYLQPETFTVDGRILIVIQVPSGSQVCRHRGRIFDRNFDSDIDITDNTDLVYQLYSRKSGSYFVNKVTSFQMDDLRSDLIDRARDMTTIRDIKHPWKSMTDEELLRSAGLILRDTERQIEGITYAAILLFGKDFTIMSILPQHKTDAIFRVENVDRYDDRDVIITNLLDTYDRMFAFGQKHLNDPFVLEGIQSVSARDHILREICSNSLAHRDYSSGYVAKLVIERNRLYTENANRSHGYGTLQLSSFEPYAKNPPISKVFREIGLADELGSGMRNTYKYSKLYSGGLPEFIEGDVFRTVIPLAPIAVEKVGPQVAPQVNSNTTQVDPNTTQVSTQVDPNTTQVSSNTTQVSTKVNPSTTQVSTKVKTQVEILAFCKEPRSKMEIMGYFGYKNSKNFTNIYIRPLLESGLLQMTNPEKPRSRSQKYVTAQKD